MNRKALYFLAVAAASMAQAEVPEQFIIRSERLILPQDEVTSSVTKLSSKSFAAGNETLENLELFTPGLNVSQNGTFGASASVQLRGSGRGFSQTYFDGLSLKDASDLDQSFQKQLLPVSFIGGAEVMRGIQSGLYGSDAVGGVINLEASGDHNQLTASAGSYDFFGLGATAKLAKTKILLDYAKADGPSAFNEEKVNSAEKDRFHSLAGYVTHVENALSHEFTLKALFIEHDQEIDGGYPFRDQVNNDLSSQSYRILAAQMRRAKAGALQYKIQLQDTSIEREVLDTTYTGSSELVQAEVSYLLSRHISGVLFSDFAHDQVDIEGEFSEKAIDNSSVGISLHEKIHSSFFSQTVRVDHHSRFGDEFTYRLGAGQKLTSLLTLRASYATGFKAPTIYQLYTSYGGNQELEPTKTNGYDVSAELKFKQTKLELSYFHTDFKSQIDYDLTRSAYFNIARSEIKGAELSLLQSFTPQISWTLNGTYLWAKNKISGAKLLNRPELTLSSALSYNVFEGHKLSLLGLYKGERIDSVGTMPPYFIFSLHGEHEVGPELQAFWKVRNLLDRAYEDVRNYGTYQRSFIIGVKRTI